MLSTRKQKAGEKRSRQSDVMSDVENLDIMLGSFSENYFDRHVFRKTAKRGQPIRREL